MTSEAEPFETPVEARRGRAIFLFGYAGCHPVDLVKWCIKRDAVVLDARWEARTRQPGWDAYSLDRELHTRYIHVRAWGNPNYKNAALPIEICDFDGGWEIAQNVRVGQKRRIVVMCGCRDEDTCHRSVIAATVYERFGIRCGSLNLRREKHDASADVSKRQEALLI